MSNIKRATPDPNDESEWLLLQIRSAFHTIREKSLHRRGSYLIRDADLEIPAQTLTPSEEDCPFDQNLVQ